MRKYVKEFIDACPECCLNKAKGGQKEGQMRVGEVLPIPFRNIHLDHLGPFPRSKRGYYHILVIVCAFSKHSVLKPVRTTKTAPAIADLLDYFSTYGQPMRITTDRGTAFTSHEFQQWTEKFGVEHTKVAVRTPRANGQAERLNRTILASLRRMTKEQKDWDKELPMLQCSINSQLNSTTQMSPHELVFNFNARDFSANRFVQSINDVTKSDKQALPKLQLLPKENIEQAKLKWKSQFYAKRREPTQYRVNDLVALEHVPAAAGTSHKLEPKYKGPYVITREHDFDRYIVEDLPDIPRG